MALVEQVFVCSAPRSGSTFLDMVLGGHSGVLSLGEFSFFSKVLALDEACGCGEPFSQCRLWARVLEHVRSEKGIDLLKNPYALWQWDTRAVRVIDREQQTRMYLFQSMLRNLWLALREQSGGVAHQFLPLPVSLKRGLENSLYLYDVIRAQSGKQVLVDSSKNLFKALEVYRARPESTKIILLTRDGRGVLHSRRKSGVPRKKIVNAWVKYNSRALRLLERHVSPQDSLMVRYESLATDPASALDTLCDFLGVPYEPGMCELESGFRHVVNGNQGTKENQKLGVRLDESWRNNLSSQDLAYFYRVAGRLSIALGYPN